MHIIQHTKFDFLRWRWHAIALSWVVIIAGLFVFFTKGIPLGLEFAGGTQVIVQFDQTTSVQQGSAHASASHGDPGTTTVEC